MSTLDQIVYRAPNGASGTILPTAASLQERSEMDRWLVRLDPWLRVGAPIGRGYLNFGSQAALIRWKESTTSGYAWQFAHVLVGQASTLTAGCALQLPALPAQLLRLTSDGRLPRVADSDLGVGPAPGAIEGRARSASSIELLVGLLSRVLAGEQSITMPWTAPQLPEAVMWGLVSILPMLGDSRPVSFFTYASGRSPASAGLFVSFRETAAAPSPDPRFEDAAVGLATGYADGPAQLRQTLLQHRILEPADRAGMIARLLDIWPPTRPAAANRRAGNDQTPNAYPGSPYTVNASPGGQTPATKMPMPSAHPGRAVTCPICLYEFDDWTGLPRWRWDSGQSGYTKIEIPADASRGERGRLLRGAFVRCPDPRHALPDEHYLPADYGQFGAPVVLGFIGVTRSGKSHLLTAIVGEIARGGLQDYGISSRPIDHGLHKRFLEESVRPLINDGKVLPGTQEGVVTFADAFLISPAGGLDRPVALFDVAGGELTKVDDTKRFLDIADGLIFVVDPAQLNADGLGDDTFNTVLDLVRSTEDRLPDLVSAAIVLNKADMLRFEDPVAPWLRADSKMLDAQEIIRESADVYAFLYEKGGAVWTRPYRECTKATLHVASPTGGADQREGEERVYPRGVTPRRVLRPLVAMLAMTGVLTGAEAEMVGI
jgi:hypothetical protein